MKHLHHILFSAALALLLPGVLEAQQLRNPTKSKHYKLSHQAHLEKEVDHTPPVLQASLAEAFGDLYVWYNGRACQMHTLAIDLARTVYGADSYKGLTPEQLLSGYVFYTDEWITEPIVRLEGATVQGRMDARSPWVGLADFYADGEYRLASLVHSGNKDALGVDARVQMLSGVVDGSLLRIWPPVEEGDSWHAVNDPQTEGLDEEDLLYRHSIMDSVRAAVARGHNVRAHNMLSDIQLYQTMECEQGELPTHRQVVVERWLRTKPYLMPFWALALLLGLSFGIPYTMRYYKHKRINTYSSMTMNAFMICLWLAETMLLGIYVYAYENLPLTTLSGCLFLLGWATLLAGCIYVVYNRRRNKRGMVGGIAMFSNGLLLLASNLFLH